MAKITEILTKHEIQQLNQPSDLRGFSAVGTTWLMIAGSFWIAAHFQSITAIALALIILGGRHLALAILMHDASHYSLFKTRWLNDSIGAWLCAYPTWQHLERYRVHHIDHHKFAGSEKDPDESLVLPYPASPASLRRKFFRDVAGITGVKRVYGLILMDLGYIKYTAAGTVTWLAQEHRTRKEFFKTAVKNLRGVLLTNLALLGVLAMSGHAWLYLLWIISYLTVFSVFVRIRSIAEHACTEHDLDPFKNTRTTYANVIARVTVAPIRVNYHLEHHLLMTVPYFNLPRLHRILRERGALEGAHVARGYLEILRLASAHKKRA